MKKSFVVFTYDFDPGSGGIKVMHKLCDMLNKNGYQSYLLPVFNNHDFRVCADYDTPIVPSNIFENPDDYIFIFPEGIHGSSVHGQAPFKNIVRWLLGPYDEAAAKTYGENDLVYWYMDYYYNEALGQKENQLFVSEYHDGIFTDRGYKRQGSCFTIRKGKPEKYVHPSDAHFISFEAGRDQVALSELFNKCETFYCYDNYTFLYTQAAMCGCTTIVVPDPGADKETWLNGSRLNKYGVAFGEDDIPRAKETLPLMLAEIEQMKLEMNEGVIKFAEHCLNYYK
jgi:hypothetical protein